MVSGAVASSGVLDESASLVPISRRSPVGTDGNLLFGVLALQLDLIDRDGFVSACAAWATRKDTPLSDVLIGLGLLAPKDRAEVESLLKRRLKKHGGDVQASLAEAADEVVRGAVA